MTSDVIRTGLIGEHISQTRFGRAMAMMCDHAGLPFEFDLIDAADRPGFDFATAVEDLKRKGWSGTAVTHPYKRDAAELAGEGMGEGVRRLGAANSLRFGMTVEGFNTDYTGFLSAWQHEMTGHRVGRVALAGAGGVARAVAPALVKLGAEEIVVWDIDFSRASMIADLAGPAARAVKVEDAHEAILQADGLANCSPVGMEYLPGSAFPLDAIGGQAWAFDAIYMPVKTEFLEDCRFKGLTTLSGFDFFRHMILDSFEVFTGVTPNRADMMPRLEALNPE